MQPRGSPFPSQAQVQSDEKIACPSCGEPISPNAPVCPRCKQPVKQIKLDVEKVQMVFRIFNSFRTALFWSIALLVIAFFLIEFLRNSGVVK